MTVPASEYHRTFIRYGGSSGRMPTQAEWAKISNKIAQRPGTVPQASTGSVNDTRRFHKAWKIDGSQLREIQIYEKGDQKFEQAATLWEKKWSRLIPQNDSPLLPVVDDNATVVGYCGDIMQSHLLIGRATGMALVLTTDEVLKYHRMYVGEPSLHAESDLSVYGSEWHYYTVVTDIHGEVTSYAFAYRSNNGTAESTPLPGLGWLKLIQTGFKALISVRIGHRTLGRQPPTPPPTPRALPPGRPEPPSAPVANPTNARPGTPTNPGSARPGNPTYSGPTSMPPVRDPRSRAQMEHDIELARQKAVAAGGQPRQMTPLPVAVNKIRKEMGLPPIPNATIIDAPRAIANEALVKRIYDEYIAWLKANPNAPLSFKLDRLTRLNRAKYGAPFPND